MRTRAWAWAWTTRARASWRGTAGRAPPPARTRPAPRRGGRPVEVPAPALVQQPGPHRVGGHLRRGQRLVHQGQRPDDGAGPAGRVGRRASSVAPVAPGRRLGVAARSHRRTLHSQVAVGLGHRERGLGRPARPAPRRPGPRSKSAAAAQWWARRAQLCWPRRRPAGRGGCAGGRLPAFEGEGVRPVEPVQLAGQDVVQDRLVHQSVTEPVAAPCLVGDEQADGRRRSAGPGRAPRDRAPPAGRAPGRRRRRRAGDDDLGQQVVLDLAAPAAHARSTAAASSGMRSTRLMTASRRWGGMGASGSSASAAASSSTNSGLPSERSTTLAVTSAGGGCGSSAPSSSATSPAPSRSSWRWRAPRRVSSAATRTAAGAGAGRPRCGRCRR